MIQQRFEEMQAEMQEQREEKSSKRDESRYMKWTKRLADMDEKHKKLEQKIEDKHNRALPSVFSSHSSEFNDENGKAQKEYVRLRNELERSEYKMRSKKKFKDVTEKAESLGEGQLDSRCTRMKALFNMYFAEKEAPKDS